MRWLAKSISVLEWLYHTVKRVICKGKPCQYQHAPCRYPKKKKKENEKEKEKEKHPTSPSGTAPGGWLLSVTSGSLSHG